MRSQAFASGTGVCGHRIGHRDHNVPAHRPETRYVAVGDADVAYQVLGDGPRTCSTCIGSANTWVGALSTAGEVLVSGTAKDLVVCSGIEFEDRGEHELKGVLGTWKLFAVRS